MNNNLKKFKEDYNKAKEDDKEVFDSMGVMYDINYAKYLIEYLESQ